MNLLHNTRILCTSRSSEGGSSANNSNVVDMQGFDGVMFIAHGNSEWESTKITLNLFGSTVSTTGGKHLLQATTVPGALVASEIENRLFLLDSYRHGTTHRYFWAQVYSNSTHPMGWVSIQYNSRYPGSTNLYDSTAFAKALLLVGVTS